jgi:hypothetical protein
MNAGYVFVISWIISDILTRNERFT